MATFTITTAVNWDSQVGKTGGDIINCNGGTLTIDGHSRFDLNASNASATAATSLGNITISATLGGTVNIDGRFVRMIPYNTGSGTLPAMGSLVTQGGASGKLMCVYSSLTAAPVTSGAIPATGWLMIKQWNSVSYVAGALTLSGITATATGADFQGFLEIFGDDSSTATLNRLGSMNIYGAWYQLGTTNATAGQTFQIPNHGTLKHFAGVFIEKTVGSNDYEFYPNGGTTITAGTTVATGTEAARGKMVWINNTGLVTIGNSGGTGLNGHVPITGLKVVVPNIFLCCCTATGRNAEVIPNASPGTRYDFTTTGGGVFTCDKVNFCWYPSFSQAYSVQMTDSGVIDAMLLSEIASPIILTKVGVGNKPTTALVAAPLTITFCPEGGTLTECVFSRVVSGGNNSTSVILSDLEDFNFNSCTFLYNALRAHTGVVTVTATRVNNSNFNTCKIIDGALSLVTCLNVNVTNLIHINAIVGTTQTTNPVSAINLASSCLNIIISGLTLPVTNNHPYTGLVAINAAGCANIKLRNIGTRVAPLSLGSANTCGLVLTVASNAALNTMKIQRVYVSNTRTGFWTADNSSTKIVLENSFGDYADAADVIPAVNSTFKGYGGTLALTAQTGVYGTHFFDCFTSTTAGRIGWMMNEPTALTSSQVTLANGAAFTSAGGLYMPVIGHTATFTHPEFILGHTAFQNSALVMAGGTVANYRFRYQIDKGSGFGAWSASGQTAAQLATLLNAETGISASVGIKLKLEVSTTTTNTTAITSMYLLTNSTTTAQDFQYPLDVSIIQVNGVVANSRIKIVKTSDSSVLFNELSATSSKSFTTDFTGEVRIEVRNGDPLAPYKPWFTIVTVGAGVTVTALQETDI